ncbi:MAG: transcriptional repressor [Patescibacteria group bacterium]|jgi:Fe2+ or Zn2+ uptake regulation protein
MKTRNRDCERRLLLLEHIQSRHDHPTAAECFLSLRKLVPTIGQSTIYRHLDELTKQGLIEEIALPNQPSHYDANIKIHAHFLCTSCNKLDDVDVIVRALWPGTPDSILVMAKGTCNQCKKQLTK